MTPAELLTAVPGVGDARRESRPALAMARQLHDTVAQRLAGLSLLLAAQSRPFDRGERERCHAEVIAALAELREGLEGALDGSDAAAHGAEQELERLREVCPGLRVRSPSESWPAGEFGELVDAVVAEALRNARKHATPRQVLIERVVDAETVTIVVRNDGVRRGCRSVGCGMGLRLLQVQAATAGCIVESSADGAGWWRVQLVLPIEA
jgi:signal transduction histidine kinase